MSFNRKKKWLNLSAQVWKTKIEGDAQILSWKILYKKIFVGY